VPEDRNESSGTNRSSLPELIGGCAFQRRRDAPQDLRQRQPDAGPPSPACAMGPAVSLGLGLHLSPAVRAGARARRNAAAPAQEQELVVDESHLVLFLSVCGG
jgi:hypothetical protein